MMESLTSRVLEYQRSQAGLEGLVAEIAPRVLRFPRRRFGWDEDACSEFYLFVYPRLLRILDRFRDQGKPFESYLSSVLHWQARSFARRRKKDERAWAMGFRLGPVAEPDQQEVIDPAESPAPCRVEPPRLGPSDRKGLLYLVLKCCRRLDPGGVSAAAAATGVDPRRLAGMVEQLRAGLEPVERRLVVLRERRNRAFSDARLLEAELAGQPDDGTAEALRLRLAAANRRMNTAMARMARVRRDPTNREVARVLGVPKGTVDSGLFWLKRRLSPGYDPDRERTA
jgi:RNA polymerase sigma factor (sigma-70 family)